MGEGSLLSEPSSRVAEGVAITMATREQTTANLTANQIQLIQRPRMAGLAAANCAQPQAEGWLLTGMAGSGFESILHVANPNPVEAPITKTRFAPFILPFDLTYSIWFFTF